MRAWVNGQLLESPEDRAISVLDHGMIVGDGVFETIKIENSVPFALTRHLDRLVASAHGLGIGAPDISAIREGVDATIQGRRIPFGRIRVTVTSGPGPLGSPRGTQGLTSVVITESCDRPAGISTIVTVPWPRNERGAIAGLKTTSYAENALMIEHAFAREASEAVMPNTVGMLCEGTGSNVFYVLDGQLITPTLKSGCLAGVTRALVLDWCDDAIERDESIDVLQRADEVILVGTTRDVQAISRVDARELQAPGPVTAEVQQIWAREVLKDIDP